MLTLKLDLPFAYEVCGYVSDPERGDEFVTVERMGPRPDFVTYCLSPKPCPKADPDAAERVFKRGRICVIGHYGFTERRGALSEMVSRIAPRSV
ncbi:hypothetical protein [uncultured Rhodospira sp.]|uniref:hypothetical protein n=1 Tax=uncultured Rhodospira sp. TaxID=1936189 RepID=UPI0026205990|nr:hypothetical protein [uncultured Rhodospira sp.]